MTKSLRRRIPRGLADKPEPQLQEAVAFEPDTQGHKLVYGTSGAGKTTVLPTIANAPSRVPQVLVPRAGSMSEASRTIALWRFWIQPL